VGEEDLPPLYELLLSALLKTSVVEKVPIVGKREDEEDEDDEEG
jgi:hypothetical protein